MSIVKYSTKGFIALDKFRWRRKCLLMISTLACNNTACNGDIIRLSVVHKSFIALDKFRWRRKCLLVISTLACNNAAFNSDVIDKVKYKNVLFNWTLAV